jgi:hypothetical protein
MWRLNHKTQGLLSDTLETSVSEIRKMSLLPDIRDDAIKSLIDVSQGLISNVEYTAQFSDFLLRRSRQPLTGNSQCVRFISD